MSSQEKSVSDDMSDEKISSKEATKRAKMRAAEAKAAQSEIKLQKLLRKEEEARLNEEGMFGTLSEPRKALTSYLRNQNKIEVNLINIRDKKAAIIIRISTTVISGLIVFHDYIDKNVGNGHAVSQILIFGLLVSLILAILSAKPFRSIVSRKYKKQILPNYPNQEENNFLFHSEMPLEEYEQSMAKVIKSQNLQIGNQIRANYILQQNNMRKARLLDISYNVFIVTFVLVAIVFSLSNYHFT